MNSFLVIPATILIILATILVIPGLTGDLFA
jgi:hypothetical protein